MYDHVYHLLSYVLLALHTTRLNHMEVPQRARCLNTAQREAFTAAVRQAGDLRLVIEGKCFRTRYKVPVGMIVLVIHGVCVMVHLCSYHE